MNIKLSYKIIQWFDNVFIIDTDIPVTFSTYIYTGIFSNKSKE